MRPFRSLLTVAAAASVFTAVATGTAAAAPPVGCYGVPSIPSAFVCITSFTPGGAVPSAGVGGGSIITVPAVCAGECYGPFQVAVPGVDWSAGSGQVATLTYDGTTYVVAAGGGNESCPGRPMLAVDTDPVLCVHERSVLSYDDRYVGTCVTGKCTLIPVDQLDDRVFDWIDDPCHLLPTC